MAVVSTGTGQTSKSGRPATSRVSFGAGGQTAAQRKRGSSTHCERGVRARSNLAECSAPELSRAGSWPGQRVLSKTDDPLSGRSLSRGHCLQTTPVQARLQVPHL